MITRPLISQEWVKVSALAISFSFTHLSHFCPTERRIVGSSLPSAVKAIAAEVWQPTIKKQLRLEEIVNAWRNMAGCKTYVERRLVAPKLHSAFARNRFKSKGRDDPLYLAHYDILLRHVKRTKHCKV